MNHLSVTTFLSLLAFGVGVGELLIENRRLGWRKFGRAVKLASLLTAGGWAIEGVISGFDPNTSVLSRSDVAWAVGIFFLVVALILLIDRVGCLKPPE